MRNSDKLTCSRCGNQEATKFVKDLEGVICRQCGCVTRPNIDDGQDWRSFESDIGKDKNTRVDKMASVDSFGIGGDFGIGTSMLGSMSKMTRLQKSITRTVVKHDGSNKGLLTEENGKHACANVDGEESAFTKDKGPGQVILYALTEDKVNKLRRLSENIGFTEKTLNLAVTLLKVMHDSQAAVSTRVKHTTACMVALLYHAAKMDGAAFTLHEVIGKLQDPDVSIKKVSAVHKRLVNVYGNLFEARMYGTTGDDGIRMCVPMKGVPPFDERGDCRHNKLAGKFAKARENVENFIIRQSKEWHILRDKRLDFRLLISKRDVNYAVEWANFVKENERDVVRLY